MEALSPAELAVTTKSLSVHVESLKRRIAGMDNGDDHKPTLVEELGLTLEARRKLEAQQMDDLSAA